MYCTVEQVRNCNDKLSSTSDISDETIENRIAEADKTIRILLSVKYTTAELAALSESDEVVNLLSTWKAVELSLAYLYGAARQVDQVSDIEYWRKKFDDVIERILSGEINLTTTVAKPVITQEYLKLFPEKGISGFEQGSKSDKY